jgi:hypothetical protein
MADLISRTTRGMFRDLMTNSTWGRISAAFQDEGFAPNPDCTYEDSSVRQQMTQSYLEGIDWRSPDQVGRALRVFERLVHDFRDQETQQTSGIAGDSEKHYRPILLSGFTWRCLICISGSCSGSSDSGRLDRSEQAVHAR